MKCISPYPIYTQRPHREEHHNTDEGLSGDGKGGRKQNKTKKIEKVSHLRPAAPVKIYSSSLTKRVRSQ